MKKIVENLLVGFILAVGAPVSVTSSIYFHQNYSISVNKAKAIVHKFTLEDALHMNTFHMRTSTNWTDVSDFKGVRISDVLDKFNLKGDKLRFVCLDGYSFEIPMSDVRRYNLLLAYSRDGAIMTVNTLGPFAIIYPRALFPKELSGTDTDAKFIWMIKDVFLQ